MVNGKLISVRLDTETLQRIDELAAAQEYRTRSSVINSILGNACQCAEPDALFRLIDTRWAFDKGYVLQFNVERGKAAQRAAVRE